MRAFFATLLLLIMTVFIIQNVETVSVNFLIWTVAMPRALLLACTVGVGIFIGVLMVIGGKKK